MKNILVVAGLPDDAPDGDAALLASACHGLGEAIQRAGHRAVVCSVHPHAADLHVLQGVADAANGHDVKVIAHLPDHPQVPEWLGEVEGRLRNVRFEVRTQSTPAFDTEESRTYAYLTCQLLAADEADAVVAIGGRVGGAMSLFLAIADVRNRTILPLRYVLGAANHYLWQNRTRYEVALGDEFNRLGDVTQIDAALNLIERLSPTTPRPEDDHFFISYSRKRNGFADVAENVLRREGLDPFRDKNDITVGDRWKAAIADELDSAAVVVVLWSREFACSPHCFIEMEQTLRRRERAEGDDDAVPALWIFKLDDTRMTFPGVDEELHSVECRSKRQLEEQLLIKLKNWRERHAAPVPDPSLTNELGDDQCGERRVDAPAS